jgi:hypothetical protein
MHCIFRGQVIMLFSDIYGKHRVLLALHGKVKETKGVKNIKSKVRRTW